MQEYVVKEKFTLSLLNNSAHSMGIDANVGDRLFYDGYNVQFGGIKDASLSLKSAIRAGWLVPVAEVSDVITAPSSQKYEEYQEVVKDASVPSSSGNNGQLLYSEASSSTRGRNVEDNEGNIERVTSYNDAGSRQNQVVKPESGRVKLAVLENEDSQIVGTIRTDRGDAQLMKQGAQGVDVSKAARGIPSRGRPVIEDANEMNELEVPLKRALPSNSGKIEVTTSTPRSEEAIEKAVYKKAGIESSAIDTFEDMTVSSLGSNYVEATLPGSTNKSVSSNIEDGEARARAQKEDWERQRSEAIARRKAMRSATATPEVTIAEVPPAPPAPPAPPTTPEEPKVNGFTYSQMKGAGWSDSQLLASEYASLVPVPPAPAPAPAPALVQDPAPAKPQATLDPAGKEVFPKGWGDLKLDEKVKLVETLSDKTQLEGIRTSKLSHWKVRNAAKERLTKV